MSGSESDWDVGSDSGCDEEGVTADTAIGGGGGGVGEKGGYDGSRVVGEGDSKGGDGDGDAVRLEEEGEELEEEEVIEIFNSL